MTLMCQPNEFSALESSSWCLTRERAHKANGRLFADQVRMYLSHRSNSCFLFHLQVSRRAQMATCMRILGVKGWPTEVKSVVAEPIAIPEPGSHPLDASSNPLVRTVPQFARQFQHDVQQASFSWQAAQHWFDAGEVSFRRSSFQMAAFNSNGPAGCRHIITWFVCRSSSLAACRSGRQSLTCTHMQG